MDYADKLTPKPVVHFCAAAPVHIPAAVDTPYRTQRVPVAQDLEWELLPVQHPDFLGLGDDPVTFPEIETTYGWESAQGGGTVLPLRCGDRLRRLCGGAP